MRSLVFAMLVVAGCGGGGSVEPFVGHWLVTNDDRMVVCGSVTSDIKGFRDDFTLTASDGDLAHQGCSLRLRVSGTAATLVSPAACDYSAFPGVDFEQFDLQTSDGQTITGAVAGHLGGGSPCTLTAHFAGWRQGN